MDSFFRQARACFVSHRQLAAWLIVLGISGCRGESGRGSAPPGSARTTLPDTRAAEQERSGAATIQASPARDRLPSPPPAWDRLPSPPPSPKGRPPDVVLVTIDALRADHLPLYGYPLDTAPGLTSLAREGTVFFHAFTHATETTASVPALLTGRFPAGPVWEEVPPGAGMAEKLKTAGYRTGAFLSNAWLAPERGYRRGFDRFVQLDYVYPAPSSTGHKGSPRVDGKRLVDQALRFLEASSRPTFVWLHLMDVHNPYQPPAPWRGLFQPLTGTDCYVNGPLPLNTTPGDLAYMKARYDEGIRYTDALLEPLWRLTRQPARASRTWVVVTADHGEALGEHGGLGHGTTLFLEQLQVPLLMRGPGIPRGSRVDRAVGLWDILPTVLGATAIPAADQLDGQDLRGLFTAGVDTGPGGALDRPLFSALRSRFDGRQLLSVIQGTSHLIYEPDSQQGRLYRWSEDRSATRTRPVASSEPLLTTLLGFFEARGYGQPAAPLSTGRQERLESLGYIGRP